MNEVTLITTRNSIYALTISPDLNEIRCLVGTFAGQAWEVNPEHEIVLAVGHSALIGDLTTSTVQSIVGTQVPARSPRPAMGFVDAVLEHVRDLDRAWYVPEEV